MYRTAATMLTALVISGLGMFATPAIAQSASTQSASTQLPAPGPDVAACYDGTCTVTVTGPVEIPLDGRAGYTTLSIVHVGPYGVTFAVRRPGGTGFGTVSAGGTVRFGSGTGTLGVHVLELTGGTARLELTTTVP